MDIKAFINNVRKIARTSNGWSSAWRRLMWLYDIPGRFSDSVAGRPVKISFSYPAPVGKMTLTLRANKGADAFILSEVFEKECYSLRTATPINYILDLGANIGLTSIYYSKWFPHAQLACVEPVPGNCMVLRKNFEENNIRAKVFEAAATSADTTVAMVISEKDYGHKVSGISFGKVIGGQEVPVRGITVETLIHELNWPGIDLLKIDIEGYEGVLLTENNEWLSKVNIIIIEIHEHVPISTIRQTVQGYGLIYQQEQHGNWIFSRQKL